MWNKSSFLAFALLVATVLCYRVDTDVGVYGGDLVKGIEEVPFMASIWCNNIIMGCGGSVIHPQFILTAAHCTVEENCDISVQLNTITLETGEFQNVAQIFVHQKYNKKAYDYDIALLKLSQATSSSNVIKVADQNTLLQHDDSLDAYGWGKTSILLNVKHLRHVSISVLNIDVCKQLYLFFGVTITPRMFCAASSPENKGNCYGDSGGPILKGNVQVGVVSFGWSCGNLPAVYTRLSAYTTWINETIEEYMDYN